MPRDTIVLPPGRAEGAGRWERPSREAIPITGKVDLTMIPSGGSAASPIEIFAGALRAAAMSEEPSKEGVAYLQYLVDNYSPRLFAKLSRSGLLGQQLVRTEALARTLQWPMKHWALLLLNQPMVGNPLYLGEIRRDWNAYDRIMGMFSQIDKAIAFFPQELAKRFGGELARVTRKWKSEKVKASRQDIEALRARFRKYVVGPMPTDEVLLASAHLYLPSEEKEEAYVAYEPEEATSGHIEEIASFMVDSTKHLPMNPGAARNWMVRFTIDSPLVTYLQGGTKFMKANPVLPSDAQVSEFIRTTAARLIDDAIIAGRYATIGISLSADADLSIPF